TEAHAGKRRLARAAATTATARHGRIDRLIVRDDLDFLLMTLGRALAVDTVELEEDVEADHERLLMGRGGETWGGFWRFLEKRASRDKPALCEARIVYELLRTVRYRAQLEQTLYQRQEHAEWYGVREHIHEVSFVLSGLNGCSHDCFGLLIICTCIRTGQSDTRHSRALSGGFEGTGAALPKAAGSSRSTGSSR